MRWVLIAGLALVLVLVLVAVGVFVLTMIPDILDAIDEALEALRERRRK